MPSNLPHAPLDSLVQQQRQRIMGEVRERFARYGDEVCGTILVAALQSGGLQMLLLELDLPPALQIVDQLGCLSRYLAGVGPAEFLRAYKSGTSAPRHMQPHAKAGGGRATDRPAAAQDAKHPPCGMVTPAEFFDGAGNYIGPERRSRDARRQHVRERRLNLEAVSKNRRFGGDRRKSKGRRRGD